MNWSKFFYIIISIYAFYYLVNIVIDTLKHKELNNPSGHSDELTFQEEIEPEDIKPESNTPPATLEKLAELDKAEELEHANVSWARQDEDTEEITLISHNRDKLKKGRKNTTTVL